jgi:hypothetical protein
MAGWCHAKISETREPAEPPRTSAGARSSFRKSAASVSAEGRFGFAIEAQV